MGNWPLERQEQEELQAKLDEEAAISAALTLVKCTVGRMISHPPKNVGKDKNWKTKQTYDSCVVMMLIRWLMVDYDECHGCCY